MKTTSLCFLQIRGVQIGSVLNVQPTLEKVDVLVDIRDVTTVIPRNSLIEANQSGLIAEPLIDITPQLPIPDYKVGLCWGCRGFELGFHVQGFRGQLFRGLVCSGLGFCAIMNSYCVVSALSKALDFSPRGFFNQKAIALHCT